MFVCAPSAWLKLAPGVESLFVVFPLCAHGSVVAQASHAHSWLVCQRRSRWHLGRGTARRSSWGVHTSCGFLLLVALGVWLVACIVEVLQGGKRDQCGSAIGDPGCFYQQGGPCVVGQSPRCFFALACARASAAQAVTHTSRGESKPWCHCVQWAAFVPRSPLKWAAASPSMVAASAIMLFCPGWCRQGSPSFATFAPPPRLPSSVMLRGLPGRQRQGLPLMSGEPLVRPWRFDSCAPRRQRYRHPWRQWGM